MGKVIRYDTVSKLGWSVDIRTHGIAVIAEKLLAADWEGAEQGGVPGYYEEEDCVVRFRCSHTIRPAFDKYVAGLLQLGVWQLQEHFREWLSRIASLVDLPVAVAQHRDYTPDWPLGLSGNGINVIHIRRSMPCPRTVRDSRAGYHCTIPSKSRTFACK